MNRLIGNKKLLKFEWIVAFSIFFMTENYFKWRNPLGYMFSYIIVLYLFYSLSNYSHYISYKNLPYAIGFSVLFAWMSLSQELDSFGIGTMILLVVPYCILIPFYKRQLIFDTFLQKIFPVIIGISVLTYLLHLIGIYNFTNGTILPINELKRNDYLSYIFFLKSTDITHLGRFLSYYDEPGVLGSILAVILFFYGSKLKKYPKIVYIIAGCLTLSLVFFIFLLASFVVNGKFKGSRKYFIWTLLSFLILFQLFGTKYVGEEISRRFDPTSGSILVDNRNTEGFKDYFFDVFIHTDELWTGTSANNIDNYSLSSSSIYTEVYYYGLLYVLYGSIMYLLFFIRYKTSIYSLLLNIFFWGLFMYQRPNYANLFYYFFFTSAIESSYWQLKEKSHDIKTV